MSGKKRVGRDGMPVSQRQNKHTCAGVVQQNVRSCNCVCVHVCGSGGNEKINLKRVQGEGAHTKSEVASANRAMPPTPHPGIKPRSHAFFVGDVRKV